MIVIKLGCVIPQHKYINLNLSALHKLQHANYEIEMIQINPLFPLEQQSQVDMILHKIQDVIIEDLNVTDKQEAIAIIEKFAENARRLSIPMIDTWDTVNLMLHRLDILQVVKKCACQKNGIQVLCPPTYYIDLDMKDDSFFKIMKENDIKFPFIVKPNGGILPKYRYEMSLHFTSNLPYYPTIISQFKDSLPCIIQQFYNHGGMMYKLYVIGDEWYVTPRPSIVDIPDSQIEPLYFKSCNISKRVGESTLSSLIDISTIPINKCAGLDEEVIDQFLTNLHSHLSFELIGIDLIVDTKSKIYYIIDVNYFPGFKGVPDFKQKLIDIFIRYKN